MARKPSVALHLSVEEVTAKIKGTVGFWRVQKWLVIYNLLVAPRPLKEIALHVGLGWQTVKNLVSAYNRLGPEVVEGPGKGGRRRANLTVKEEAQFLAPFFERASTGQVATAMEIKRTLERHVGHSVHKTTVYRLLARHGWRKVVPRPFHKQAKKEKQEEFKKNSLKR
jgi:transposase